MNNPENRPLPRTQEEIEELNYAAIYAHGLLDDMLSIENGIIDSFERQLFPGFIDEQDTEFVDASHVTLARNDERFFVMFEDTDDDEFYMRNVYVIDQNDITLIHQREAYSSEEKAIILKYRRAWKSWVETLSTEARHQFHFGDEANRLANDLKEYKKLKHAQDLYLRDMIRSTFEDDEDHHAQDAGRGYEELGKKIKSLGVSLDSNLGRKYENSYQVLLLAAMESLDLETSMRHDTDAGLHDRFTLDSSDRGMSIGRNESSSLIRVIEKVIKSPSRH